MSYPQPKEFNDFVRSIYVPQSEQDFLQTVADGILKLIPGENVMAAILNLQKTHISFCADALPLLYADTPERFTTYLSDHPLCDAVKTAGYPGHYFLSDRLSRTHWHRMEVYNEIYRREEIEDEWSLQIGNPGSAISCISILREKQGFADSERLMIEMLVPHLIQAGENARQFDSSIPTALIAQAEEDLREGMVLLDSQRRVMACSEVTRRLLAAFFPIRERKFERLPHELDAWLSKVDAPPFTKVARYNALEIRAYRDKASKRYLLTIRPSGPSFATIALKPLGLSPRQAEVLYWVAQGKRTDEIAVIMDISFFTIKNHISNIFAIMGVETRTAAAAIALRLL